MAAIGERRGRNNVDNCPQYQGIKTRELAAQRSGFDSYKTYERARRVVENGVQELVEAMDAATTLGGPCAGMCGSWSEPGFWRSLQSCLQRGTFSAAL
jgi:hypothetical protein